MCAQSLKCGALIFLDDVTVSKEPFHSWSKSNFTKNSSHITMLLENVQVSRVKSAMCEMTDQLLQNNNKFHQKMGSLDECESDGLGLL
jgi:hypothetical protein